MCCLTLRRSAINLLEVSPISANAGPKKLNLNPFFSLSQMAWNGRKSHATVPLGEYTVHALTYSARYFEKKKEGE